MSSNKQPEQSSIDQQPDSQQPQQPPTQQSKTSTTDRVVDSEYCLYILL
jgi:hypothetical protein